MFFALGDGTRLSVVTRLAASGALSATALSEGAHVTRQAIVKHLQVLEGAGLVTHEKRGREVLYSLDPARLHDAQAFLASISAGWDRAIRETLAPPPPVEAPMCEWPAPLTTRIVGLLPGTLDDLCARLPDARRRAVKAAIGQLVANGRAHGTGPRGGRCGARRVYLPGPRPLSEDRAA